MKRFILMTAGLWCAFGSSTTHPLAGQTKDDTVKVAGLVLRWVRGDKEANFRRIEPMIREAAAKGAKIVVTTECFLDGYAVADRKQLSDADFRALGEPIPSGAYFKKLAALAAELKITLIAGMAEADGDERYNTVVIIGPDGKLIGKYRKQNLGHELGRNTPGTLSSVFATAYGKIGVMICADRTDAKIVKRFCDNGADFLICPSGGMFGPKNNDPIVQARSKENKTHIVFVHPVEFLVTGPDGGILQRELLGPNLLVTKDQIGGKDDERRIYYFHMPAAGSLVADQEALLKKLATPGEHHQRLDALAGAWKLAVKWRNKPEDPWSESAGVAEYKWILGRRFLQEEFKYAMGDESMEWLGIYGYDNYQKQYTAVWVDNMGTNTEYAEGRYDAKSSLLSFTGEQDDPATGRKRKFKWLITIDSQERLRFDSYDQDSRGNFFKNTEVTATRQAALPKLRFGR